MSPVVEVVRWPRAAKSHAVNQRDPSWTYCGVRAMANTIRGLREDLQRVEKARASWAKEHADLAAQLAEAREEVRYCRENYVPHETHDLVVAQLAERERPRIGILPFLCPICDRKRVEYEATADGRLFVRCTKCGSDHDTICDAALAATHSDSEERAGGAER